MKNVLIFLMFFLVILKVNSQNKFELGLSSSILKFSDKAASKIGDRYLFQSPILNVNYQFNNKFSMAVEAVFPSVIKDIGFMSNSIEYSSYGGALRYHLNDFNKLKPYVFIGGTLVKTELKRTPTLNFGIGSSYWLSQRLAINTQIAYKFSEDRFESMQSHFQFSAGVIYSFNFGTIFRRKSVCETNGF